MPGRLAFSIVFEMGIDGSVVGEPWIGRSVVRNRYTFDYDTATRIVDGVPGADDKCPEDVVQTLKLLGTIATSRRRWVTV